MKAFLLVNKNKKEGGIVRNAVNSPLITFHKRYIRLFVGILNFLFGSMGKDGCFMINSARSKLIANSIAVLFILVFCLSGILTLSNYGLTWDEALGNLFFGERYLHYFATLDKSYLDFDAYLTIHQQHPLDLYLSPFRNRPHEFPALSDTASAATMYLFSYTLGWLDPVDGFHLFTTLLVTAFLFVFYFFVSRRLGYPVGLFSLFFLGTFPRLWGDMHFNVKDVPEVVLFGLALIAFWKWFEKPSVTGAVLVGIASGAALADKANALFLPVIMVLGWWPLKPKELWMHLRDHYPKYGVMLGSALIIYYLSWPYLHLDPLNLQRYFSYIFNQGGRTGTSWSWQPLSISAAVMPEIMLFCMAAGIVFSLLKLIKKGEGVYRIALVWLLVPILRISAPPAVNFDGIRHFMEFVPGAALIAGIGAAWIVRWMGRKNPNRALAAGLVLGLIIALNVGINGSRFGSFQYIYFNSVYGGLPGGSKIFGPDEATDYWGSSYRKGIEWLNENAEQNAVVYVPVASHIVDLVAPLWLREDIKVIRPYQFRRSLQEGKAVYIMFVTRPTAYDEIANEFVTLEQPIFDISVQDVPILEIYEERYH